MQVEFCDHAALYIEAGRESILRIALGESLLRE